MSDFVIERTVKVVFDTEANDNSGVANTTIAAHPSGVFIPDNAIITHAFYEVNTTFTSAGADAGTIAIHVESADDLVAAIAISDATNVWDAGIHGTLAIPGTGANDAAHNTAVECIALEAAAYIKTAGVEDVTFTVAGQVLATGKLTLYITYVVGD